MLNYIITDTNITVLINGLPKIIDNTHANFEKIKDGIKADVSEAEILRLIDTASALKDYGEGKVQVRDGEVFYKDTPIRSTLTARILTMMREGFKVDAMCTFMENLYKNPSKTAVDELYLFLESCNLPITEDGHFLAYKKVRNNYKDIYSGTFDNSVGSICEMERNEVCDDRSQTCSNGLHFASYSYMNSYGSGVGSSDRIVIVKINPSDVVSIPSDYNNAKGRCWKYEVVNEVENDGKTQIKSDCIEDGEAYSPTLKIKDIVTDKSYDSKRFKQMTVSALYSYEILLDDVTDVVYEYIEDESVISLFNDVLYEIDSEGLNFNQSVNEIRDFIEIHISDEMSNILYDITKVIEHVTDTGYYSIPVTNVSNPITSGISGVKPYTLRTIEDIKAQRIQEYVDMFGGSASDVKDYTNVDLRKAVESGQPLQDHKTYKESTDDVHVKNVVDFIINGIKEGTIEWKDMLKLSPLVTQEMVDFNDYMTLKKVLLQEFLDENITYEKR